MNTASITAPGKPVTNRGLRIAGSLNATVTCTGQILEQCIFNQTNQAAAWNGNITFGNTTLSPTPYYDNAPSALGGGSVGLAPFRIHYEACSPVGAGDPTVIGNCAHHASENNTVSVVQITHYGPVGLHDGNDFVTAVNGRKGFTVERAKEGECVWTNLTNDFTTVLVGGNDRTLQLQGPFSQGACGVNCLYRIRPVVEPAEGRLVVKCRDVAGNPTVALSEYVLRIVATDCGEVGGN